MVGKNKPEKEKDKEFSFTTGALEDCQELLRRFSAKPTVRFQDFVTVWQEMGFSYIYCGRPSFRELFEFVEELFHIAKAFMFSPYPYRTRIGGIYMMYGLYFKQPFNDRLLPIKLDLNEWKEMVSFVQILIKDEHFDTFYIFRTLVEKHAFSYEASSVQYGFDRYTREKLANLVKKPQKFDPMKYGLTLFDEIDFVDEWSKFEKYYQTLKTESEDFSTANSCIPPNWPVEVLHAIASASTSAVPAISRRPNSKSENENHGLSIGSRRSLLKNRSFATKKNTVSVRKTKKGCGSRKKVIPRPRKVRILRDEELSESEPEDLNEVFLPELEASKEC